MSDSPPEEPTYQEVELDYDSDYDNIQNPETPSVKEESGSGRVSRSSSRSSSRSGSKVSINAKPGDVTFNTRSDDEVVDIEGLGNPAPSSSHDPYNNFDNFQKDLFTEAATLPRARQPKSVILERPASYPRSLHGHYPDGDKIFPTNNWLDEYKKDDGKENIPMVDYITEIDPDLFQEQNDLTGKSESEIQGSPKMLPHFPLDIPESTILPSPIQEEFGQEPDENKDQLTEIQIDYPAPPEEVDMPAETKQDEQFEELQFSKFSLDLPESRLSADEAELPEEKAEESTAEEQDDTDGEDSDVTKEDTEDVRRPDKEDELENADYEETRDEEPERQRMLQQLIPQKEDKQVVKNEETKRKKSEASKEPEVRAPIASIASFSSLESGSSSDNVNTEPPKKEMTKTVVPVKSEPVKEDNVKKDKKKKKGSKGGESQKLVFENPAFQTDEPPEEARRSKEKRKERKTNAKGNKSKALDFSNVQNGPEIVVLSSSNNSENKSDTKQTQSQDSSSEKSKPLFSKHRQEVMKTKPTDSLQVPKDRPSRSIANGKSKEYDKLKGSKSTNYGALNGNNAELYDKEFSKDLEAMIMDKRKASRKISRRGNRSRKRSLHDLENGVTDREDSDLLRMYRADRSAYSKEQIFENIQLQKQLISNVRNQPWPMKRKLKTVK